MQISELQIKNFRCFDQLTLDVDHALVLIEGANGIGKTSLLEALHYLCYLRSFRTHLPRELVRFDQEGFFIKAHFSSAGLQAEEQHELQVGFSDKQRLVRLNKKAISSYKELMDLYRVITLTEDDLLLIQGPPEARRTFIDQAIMLNEASYLDVLKQFKKVLSNRNSLLHAGHPEATSYRIWTEQLWQISKTIAHKRSAMLHALEKQVNELLIAYFGDPFRISLRYQIKNGSLDQTYEQFLSVFESTLKHQEMRFARSVFGAHLDDFIIDLANKRSKGFASRGQQKLAVLLIKTAQVYELAHMRGKTTLLLDDFITDLDEQRIEQLLTVLLATGQQLIFTVPLKLGFLNEKLRSLGARVIKLPI